MSVEVRPVEPADCREIPAFREAMEGGDFLRELRDEAFYRHKLLAAGTGFVARAGGRIVGTTSATRRRVRLGGRTVPAADLGDLFVHPEHRGRGLFRALHDAVLGVLRQEGTALVTVRAGRGAAPLLIGSFGYRAGFRIAECIAALTDRGLASLPFGRTPLLRRLLPRARRRPAGETAGARVVAVSPGEIAPPDAFGGPWPGAGVVRDADRVRVRYAEEPSPYEALALTEGEEVRGAAILLVYRGRGFVVDLWTAPGAGSAPLLARAALGRLREAGADVAHFWRAREAGPSRDRAAAALAGEGLRAVRRRKVVLLRTLAEGVDLPPPRDWLFRMGDTDGI